MQIISLGVTTSIFFERKKERLFLIEQFIAFLLISKHHHHDHHHHSKKVPDTIGKQQLSPLFLLSSSKLDISIGILYIYTS
jgi:hypothetical protein